MAQCFQENLAPCAVNGARSVDDSLYLFRAKILPGQHLVKRAEAAEISGDGMRDLAIQKMDLTATIILGSHVQD